MLIIDPQNDFCDIPGAALPVAGAHADMQRLAEFLSQAGAALADITVTLDSHASVGIERTTFWQQGNGEPVAPFTQIVESDVRQGRYLPRDAALINDVLAYLRRLQQGNRYRLIVWPVHCVLGTWGHNIHEALAEGIARWEMQRGLTCDKVLKGLNPLTEQYSAFRAEVPRADDSRTANNATLMARLADGDTTLLVAGEALSHCVAASGDDMLAQMDATRLRNTVFLTDCMSPVAGFEQAGADFLERVRAAGARTMSTTEAP